MFSALPQEGQKEESSGAANPHFGQIRIIIILSAKKLNRFQYNTLTAEKKKKCENPQGRHLLQNFCAKFAKAQIPGLTRNFLGDTIYKEYA